MAGQILIVDDEQVVRELCARVLRDVSYEVDEAADAAEALRQCAARQYDFMLTDLTLPGAMNGQDLVEEVKRRYPFMDIVLMTAYPTFETALQVMKHGADDYLVKPVSLEHLKVVVNRCFEKRKLSAELNREKILRHELEMAYVELQKVEHLKEAFLARIDYELKTPLAPAFLALNSIEKMLTGEKEMKTFRVLKENLSQLKERIEEVLLFSEIERNKQSFYRTPLKIEDLVRGVVTRYHAQGDSRGIRIQLDFGGQPDEVWGSPRLLETAFKHLFLNAIQFSNKNGSISIRTLYQDDDVVIVFIDRGAGIPQNQISSVFDSFYQAADYLNRRVGGMGLGLAMVRRIVELHGGRVLVTSEEGQGNQFSVRLPRKDPQIQRWLKNLRPPEETMDTINAGPGEDRDKKDHE